MVTEPGTPRFRKGEQVRISVLLVLQRNNGRSTNYPAEKCLRYDGMIGTIIGPALSSADDGTGLVYDVQINGQRVQLTEDCLGGLQETPRREGTRWWASLPSAAPPQM